MNKYSKVEQYMFFGDIVTDAFGRSWLNDNSRNNRNHPVPRNWHRFQDALISFATDPSDPVPYDCLNFMELLGIILMQTHNLKYFENTVMRDLKNSASFDATYYTLKMAARHVIAGHKVEFIPDDSDKSDDERKQGVKQPDFRVEDDSGYIWVECKWTLKAQR